MLCVILTKLKNMTRMIDVTGIVTGGNWQRVTLVLGDLRGFPGGPLWDPDDRMGLVIDPTERTRIVSVWLSESYLPKEILEMVERAKVVYRGMIEGAEFGL